MSLIDVNELVEALDEALKGPTDSMDFLRKQLLVNFAKEILSDAPTVEAIPIEWIKKYLEPFYEHYNALSPESRETCGAGWVIDVLETMMKDWEKRK